MEDLQFKNTAEMRKYAPGLDASTPFVNIAPSIRTAERYIKNLITPKIFTLVAYTPLLLEAVANMAMHGYMSFYAVEKRTQTKDIYKYEVDSMKLDYLNYYQSALAELYAYLETVDEWKETSLYKIRETLLVREVEEFNNFYPIDNNYYFFSLITTIQSEVIDLYINELTISEHRDNTQLKRSCVFITMGEALQRFELSVLPHTLRSSGDDGSSSKGKSEGASLQLLSNTLLMKGHKLLTEVLQEIEDAKRPPVSETPHVNTDYNRPSNKYYSAF